MKNHTPYTEQEMRNYFKKEGYTLLEWKKGIISHQKVRHDLCGYVNDKMSFDCFKIKGHRCLKCARKLPYTEDMMRDYFKSFGYTLLKWKKGNDSNQKVRHDLCGYVNNKMRFNDFKNKRRRCPECSRSRTEKLCRQFFEEWFQRGINPSNYKFPNTRPSFLQGLELDGYNPECKMAFEYNGEQHYKYKQHWHKTYEGFLNQKKRDRKKYQLCFRNNIKLCIIPYIFNCYDPDKLKVFIYEWLSTNDYIIV